ncbi:hypothetical protein PPACK8108_LOCUS586 [Phakopsora pachyrhizi]|uniref:Uncharacterized protein n=1 Tax=Phakopsora pachyrhizi TaxID=170000 RepID=A0AAV0ADX8_PHAPC|nr:hypothetical protein PPACK8108_LOCUS586 [Phakopsora pachyrhizi]
MTSPPLGALTDKLLASDSKGPGYPCDIAKLSGLGVGVDKQEPHQANSILKNLRLIGLLTRLRPSLTRKNTSNSTKQIVSEEPQPSNQTIDPESINHQSESTAVSILSSQQMTVVNLQHSSSSSLPPTAIRPHTPDLTNSRPESPSQIKLANLVENWGGGCPSELSYRLPDAPSPILAFEINLSTLSKDSQSSLNLLGKTVDPKPLPNCDLPQHTVITQALTPSEHPEYNRSNTPGEEEDDDDVLGNEELYSAQTHLSPKDEILPIPGPKSRGSITNEMVRIIKEQALKIEEERHWLTSKLVKLTSSNQVLERERM